MAPRPPRKCAAQKKMATQQHGVVDDLADASFPSPNLEIPEYARSQAGDNWYLDQSLPPMHKLEEIFQDLASNALRLGLQNVLDLLGDRPLKVATVCSGTESPLLALEMIEKVLPSERRLRISHLFSCEIVPFKQAYIERNFRPQIIFRDLTELGGKEARTAYGSLADVPNELDMLIAGTACVDFSPLNTQQKGLDDGGESGKTFLALIEYATKNRPRIVIMENVRGAPWERFADHWAGIGYDAFHTIVDSKHYYVPQTRVRGYMVCVDNERRLEDAGKESFGADWDNLVKSMKRQASSPAGVFLLNEDDHRLEQISKDSGRAECNREVDWSRYQERHKRYRIDKELGDRRPISRSLPGGTISMPPDFYWPPFFKAQAERVWETLDLKFLVNLLKGADMNFKERWVDVSQGVDRGNESGKNFGVAGCLTPNGVPFMSTRGGPMSGLEALALQGLPIDRMILTKEKPKELQDLAGNAMTSTVVCAVILAALITFKEVLKEGAECRKQADVHPKVEFALKDGDKLLPIPKVAESGPLGLDALLAVAARTVSYCQCEKQSGSKNDLVQCTQCGHTGCIACAGSPTHVYKELKLQFRRTNTSDFKKLLQGILPMRLVLEDLPVQVFQGYRSLFPGGTTARPSREFDEYLGVITAALRDEVRFFDIRRSEQWTVMYEGDKSSLRLLITEKEIRWFVYGKPPSSAAARCLLREIMKKPIARMAVTRGSLLEGEWEVCAPISTGFCLSISGFGEQVRSYEAECGLVREDFVNSKVWTQIRVTAEDKDVVSLDVDVRGEYRFLPDCGTALGSLYKKEATTTSPNVYLFLDPSKNGAICLDSCVFSLEHGRISGYAPRMTIAELSPSWRAVHVQSTPASISAFNRAWRNVTNASLKQIVNTEVVARLRVAHPNTSVDETPCSQSFITLASLTAQATKLNLPERSSPWQPLSSDISIALKDLSWAVQGVAAVAGSLNWMQIDWNRLMPSSQATICGHCVPKPPATIWCLGRDGKSVVPLEDPKGAAEFERAIKTKPPAFMVFSHVDAVGIGELRFALNIQSMAHQAFGHLIEPKSPDISKETRFHWRLLSNVTELVRTKCRRMDIGSNKEDSCSAQPVMRLSLRQDQLRSLTWMVAQESDDTKPFLEEETEEATLPLMSWRAEVRVSTPRTIRGGMLADDVGYGKTAIILGLIATQRQNDVGIPDKPSQSAGFVATNATLIVVPQHLFNQWKAEIPKFLGQRCSVLSMYNIGDLTRATVGEFTEADIALVTWDLLNSLTYYQQMRAFTGSPAVPERGGERIFDNWFEKAERSLRELVPTLQEELPEGGPEIFSQQALARYKQVLEDQAESTYCPSKRLRGKAFALAQQKSEEDTDIGRSQTAVPPPDHHRSSEGFRSASGSRHASVFERTGSTLTRATSTASQDQSQRVEVQDARPGDIDIEDDGNYTGDDVEPGPAESRAFGEKGGTTAGQKRKRTEFEGKSKVKGPLSDEENLKREAAAIKKRFNIQPDLWRMKGLPIHAFSFARLVIDEYTYTKEDKQCSLVSLRAWSKWVLSGTPATGEFADVKSIARYLGIHLGIDDDGNHPTENARLNQARKCLSGLESLQLFQVPHSQAWYEHRRNHAQGFLDVFARKNSALISHIKVTNHPILCKQFPRDWRIYYALHCHLKKEHGQLRIMRNTQNDLQVERMNEFLYEKGHNPSHSSLLKCATVPDLRGFAWSVDKCRSKLQKQQHALDKCWKNLEFLTKQMVLAKCQWAVRPAVWADFLANVFASQFDDHEAMIEARRRMTNISASYETWIGIESKEISDVINQVVERFKKKTETKASRAAAEKAAVEETAVEEAIDLSATDIDDGDTSFSESLGSDSKDNNAHNGKKKKKNKAPPLKKAKMSLPRADKEVMITRGAREQGVAKKLHIDTVAALRKVCEAFQRIRFFKAIVTIQTAADQHCDSCNKTFASMADVVVLRSCGHILCEICIEACDLEEQSSTVALKAEEQTEIGNSDAKEQRGIKAERNCPLKRCNGSNQPGKRIHGRALEATEDSSRKLTRMISIIKDTPPDDQILLFIQWEDLIGKAKRALLSAGIDFIWAKTATDVKLFTPPDPLDGPKKRGRRKTEDGEKTECQGRKPRPKVLILQLGLVVSSGLNLQCANHVVFLSPYNAADWYEYQASMTQAIGRAVRYGQEKHVHIYHLLSMNTADVTIFQARNRGSVVCRGSKAFIVDKKYLDQRPDSILLLRGPDINFGTGDGLDIPESNPNTKEREEDEETINEVVGGLLEGVVTEAAEAAVGYTDEDIRDSSPPDWEYEMDQGDVMDSYE